MRKKLIDVFCSILGAEPDYQNEDGIRFVEELIANGVTVQQWIPVSERLPTREDANETESILAIQKDDGYVGRWIWDIVVRYPKEFTHWMPLPQLPKEG